MPPEHGLAGKMDQNRWECYIDLESKKSFYSGRQNKHSRNGFQGIDLVKLFVSRNFTSRFPAGPAPLEETFLKTVLSSA